jgi:hypothetical protein
MFEANDLVDSLAKVARVLDCTDGGNTNPTLQAMVGDPDSFSTSTFTQFEPEGNRPIPNPLSTLQGDEVFFCYLIPGAKFQSHDGSQWIIEEYPWQGVIHIANVWYPRINAHVSVADVRRSIEQWIEPITQFVPPAPPGLDYSLVQAGPGDVPPRPQRP